MTIATSILFCHRFFLRQSHAKNDRYTIATACMFLAGKVEETPKLLQNVLFISYEIRHKKDKSAANNIKQKEVYEYEKERVLLAENLVLQTLDFNINIVNPYRRLVAALKKLSIMDKFVVQVAWNFLNDSLQTSLCLQYEAHHIAAASIFLAAKFQKHKLPTDGGRQWWQELDVTVRQLEDMSNQMLELYEQRPSSVPSPTSTSGRILPTEVSPTQPPEGSCIKYKDRTGTEIMDADSNGEPCNLLQTPASSQKMNMEVSQIGSFDTHVQSKHPHQSCGSEDLQGRE